MFALHMCNFWKAFPVALERSSRIITLKCFYFEDSAVLIIFLLLQFIFYVETLNVTVVILIYLRCHINLNYCDFCICVYLITFLGQIFLLQLEVQMVIQRLRIKFLKIC